MTVGVSVTYGSDHMTVSLVRYNSDGSLDTSFNGTGIVTTDGGERNFMGRNIVVQPDGKILVAGLANIYNRYTAGYGTLLVRYNSNGSLDNSFNGSGILFDNSTLGVANVALQSDEKILVVGTTDHGNGYAIALARYNSDGSNDTSFGGIGSVYTEIGSEIGSYNEGASIALQPDGKILVAGDSYTPATGYDFNVVRYNSDGNLDSNFSDGGIAIANIGFQTHDVARSILVQPDGKILVAGESIDNPNNTEKDFALVRFNTNGSLDTTFSGNGKLTTDFNTKEDIGMCFVLQTDGSIVVAGSSASADRQYTGFALVRYRPDGSLDATFNVSQ